MKKQNSKLLVKDAHFIGCGGAGMAPLATIFHELGCNVSGSDLCENANTRQLRDMGLKISIGHKADNLNLNQRNGLLVKSSAISPDNPELLAAEAAGYRCSRRGEALAELASQYPRSIGVSGSHGKTTVTAILTHILKTNGLKPGFMLGGKVPGWKNSGAAGDGDIFVTEVDESDGSNAIINSCLGIVTNVEDDHCWNVGGEEELFANFAEFARRSKTLLYVADPLPDRLFRFHPQRIRIENVGGFLKNCRYLNPSVFTSLGDYQLLNAVTAIRAAEFLGLNRKDAESAFNSFPGVARRMATHLDTPDFSLIEDYAHHPTEVSCAISALRKKYPKRFLRVVFQPHRYARLKRYLNNFAHELSSADAVVVTPVFAAWVGDDNVHPEHLAKRIKSDAKYLELSWKDMADELAKNRRDGEVLAILGAGDVEELIPHLIAPVP